jgi:glycosyltransferase involved in cell wall biosynthesis
MLDGRAGASNISRVAGPRILYVIQHREWSGAETSQAPIIEADPDALVACPAGSPSERFARSLGAATVDLPFRSLRHSGGRRELARSLVRGVRSARDLRSVLRAHPERDVVYATSIRPALLCSLASLGLGRRVVWCVPDLLPPFPLRGPVRLAAWLRASGIVCLSSFIATDLAGRSRKLRRLAKVVHPGVDPARFDPATARPGAPVAAIVGFISPVKRTDLAIDVAERVASRSVGFRLRVVGAAQFRDEAFSMEAELKSRVSSDERLAAAVEFVGRSDDVPGTLAGCGLLLHCRDDEPFGMVMVEAMALGLPVVAPASGGALEIVEDARTGLLYRPGDAEDAARCVLRLIDEPDLARALGAAGRRRVEESFTAASQLAATGGLLSPAPRSGRR